HPAHVALADQLAHLGHQVVAGDLELLLPGRSLAARGAALRTAAAGAAAAGTARCGLVHRFLLGTPQVPLLAAPLAPQDLSIAEPRPAGEGSAKFTVQSPSAWPGRGGAGDAPPSPPVRRRWLARARVSSTSSVTSQDMQASVTDWP